MHRLTISTQVGIYLGMFIGPVAVRSAMQKMGEGSGGGPNGSSSNSSSNVANWTDGDASSDTGGATMQNAMCAMLVFSWCIQCTLVFLVKRHTAAKLTVGVATLVVMLVAFGGVTKAVGGTGADNVFSWHPILMTAAFLGLMTPAQLVYRNDMLSQETYPTKRQRRKWHAGLMAAGAAVALFGGYVTIFSKCML